LFSVKRIGALVSGGKPAGANANPKAHTVEIDGKTIRFDLSHPAGRRFFSRRYAGGRLHEAAATRFVVDALKPGSLFLDVGSNLGWFAIVAAHFAQTVYAVEPQDRMVNLIKANATLNGLDNVHPLWAAAGDQPGFVDMPVGGRPGTAVNSGKGNRVPVIRLDDYFAGDLRPDVMKIDVEGYEFNVLKGATRILQHGPAIAMELHETMSDFGASPKELLTFLHDHGYRVRTAAHRTETLSFKDVTAETSLRQVANSMVFCDRVSA